MAEDEVPVRDPVWGGSESPVPGRCGCKLGTPAKNGVLRYCLQLPGHRTNHPGSGPCVFHGGRFKDVERHHLRLLAEKKAQEALTSMGHPIVIHPGQALLELVYEAAGNVAYLGQEVAKIGDPEALTVKTQQQAEVVRAIVRLYGEWSDRLAKVSKLALDADVDNRLARVKERESEAVILTVERVVEELQLDQNQVQRARAVISRTLREVAEKHPLTSHPTELVAAGLTMSAKPVIGTVR